MTLRPPGSIIAGGRQESVETRQGSVVKGMFKAFVQSLIAARFDSLPCPTTAEVLAGDFSLHPARKFFHGEAWRSLETAFLGNHGKSEKIFARAVVRFKATSRQSSFASSQTFPGHTWRRIFRRAEFDRITIAFAGAPFSLHHSRKTLTGKVASQVTGGSSPSIGVQEALRRRSDRLGGAS